MAVRVLERPKRGTAGLGTARPHRRWQRQAPDTAVSIASALSVRDARAARRTARAAITTPLTCPPRVPSTVATLSESIVRTSVVRVPVFSRTRTSTAASASTAAMGVTAAPLAASCCAPSAEVTDPMVCMEMGTPPVSTTGASATPRRYD